MTAQIFFGLYKDIFKRVHLQNKAFNNKSEACEKQNF